MAEFCVTRPLEDGLEGFSEVPDDLLEIHGDPDPYDPRIVHLGNGYTAIDLSEGMGRRTTLEFQSQKPPVEMLRYRMLTVEGLPEGYIAYNPFGHEDLVAVRVEEDSSDNYLAKIWFCTFNQAGNLVPMKNTAGNILEIEGEDPHLATMPDGTLQASIVHVDWKEVERRDKQGKVILDKEGKVVTKRECAGYYTEIWRGDSPENLQLWALLPGKGNKPEALQGPAAEAYLAQVGYIHPENSPTPPYVIGLDTRPQGGRDVYRPDGSLLRKGPALGAMYDQLFTPAEWEQISIQHCLARNAELGCADPKDIKLAMYFPDRAKPKGDGGFDNNNSWGGPNKYRGHEWQVGVNHSARRTYLQVNGTEWEERKDYRALLMFGNRFLNKLWSLGNSGRIQDFKGYEDTAKDPILARYGHRDKNGNIIGDGEGGVLYPGSAYKFELQKDGSVTYWAMEGFGDKLMAEVQYKIAPKVVGFMCQLAGWESWPKDLDAVPRPREASLAQLVIALAAAEDAEDGRMLQPQNA